jgi:hypothetical protein
MRIGVAGAGLIGRQHFELIEASPITLSHCPLRIFSEDQRQ